MRNSYFLASELAFLVMRSSLSSDYTMKSSVNGRVCPKTTVVVVGEATLGSRTGLMRSFPELEGDVVISE